MMDFKKRFIDCRGRLHVISQAEDRENFEKQVELKKEQRDDRD